jgi:hypothetical protein
MTGNGDTFSTFLPILNTLFSHHEMGSPEHFSNGKFLCLTLIVNLCSVLHKERKNDADSNNDIC